MAEVISMFSIFVVLFFFFFEWGGVRGGLMWAGSNNFSM